MSSKSDSELAIIATNKRRAVPFVKMDGATKIDVRFKTHINPTFCNSHVPKVMTCLSNSNYLVFSPPLLLRIIIILEITER